MSKVSISPPHNYQQFPEDLLLCRVREVRDNFIQFCNATARDDNMCPWHEHLKEQHRKEGKESYWQGIEVTFPIE
jgi:hypothetical protein